MVWDVTELQHRFAQPRNADILAYLMRHHPSAHSDVAEELQKSAAHLPGVGSFCPDPQRYAYVFFHSPNDVIFALAVGMSLLALKLPPDQLIKAGAEGGEMKPELGANWIGFNPFARPVDMAGSRKRMHHWCSVALRHADTHT